MIADTPLGNALTNTGELHFERYGVAFNTASFLLAQMLIVGGGTALGFEKTSRIWQQGSGIYDSNEVVLDFLLKYLRNCSPTDSRDHIFGLIGILKTVAERHVKKPVFLVADYKLAAADLYTHVMTHMLEERQSLTLSSRVQPASKARVPGLPSWVIDFSVRTAKPLLDLPSSEHRMFDASSNVRLGFSIDGRTLMTYHIVLAQVIHMGETGDDFHDTKSFEKSANLAVEYMEMMPQGCTAGHDLTKAMTCDLSALYSYTPTDAELTHEFRAMLLNLRISQVVEGVKQGPSRSETINQQVHQNTMAEQDPDGPMPFADELTSVCDCIGILEDGFGEIDQSITVKLMKDMQPFSLFIMRTMADRRTLLTSNGFIGLGSEDVRPGDGLCLFSDGARTPFLMRKIRQDSDDNGYTLLGEAYVKGFMHGEGVGLAAEDGNTWKPVSIV